MPVCDVENGLENKRGCNDRYQVSKHDILHERSDDHHDGREESRTEVPIDAVESESKAGEPAANALHG